MSWTSPRTWVASEVVTADIMNTHVKNQLLHIAGTSGFTDTPSATRGIEPPGGYFVGGVATHIHVQAGTVNLTRNASRTGSAAVSWTAFSSAPYVVVCPLGANGDGWDLSGVGVSGCTINDRSANENTIAYHWIAVGVKN